jgi:hypothetical protein
LSPEEGIRFLRDFYVGDAGNYLMAADKESFAELVPQTAGLSLP